MAVPADDNAVIEQSEKLMYQLIYIRCIRKMNRNSLSCGGMDSIRIFGV